MSEKFRSNPEFENKSLRELEYAKILAETKKNKEELKEKISTTIINKLNSKEGYIVRNDDILSLINKITSYGNHINFNNEGDKIHSGDVIKIIDGKVYKNHNGNNEVVGIVTEGFKKIETKAVIQKDTKKVSVIEEAKKANEKIKKDLETRKGSENINKEAKKIVDSKENNSKDNSEQTNKGDFSNASFAMDKNVEKINFRENKDEKTTTLKDYLDKLPKNPKTRTEAENNNKIETTETISNYFDINIDSLKQQIESNGLNLDLIKFLVTYKNYIENNLKDLDPEIVDKIKESISRKIQELSKIIKERIDWVDEQIEEGDYESKDRQKEIQNQRWVINKKLNDLFSEINNEVLPSAMILAKKVNTKALDEDLEISTMFDADLTDDGEFDKTIWSGELYDSAVNSWSVMDSTNDEHTEFMKKNGIQTIEPIDILSEKDLEIKKYADYTFYSLLALQIGAEFTPIGWTAGAAIDGADIFADEDVLLKMARQLPWVDDNYRMDKQWYENALAAIGLIPGATFLTKGDKLYTFFKRMGPDDKTFFMQMLDKVGDQMGITKNTLGTIKEKLFNYNPIKFNEKYINPKTGTKYTKNSDGKFVNSEGKILKNKPKNIEKVSRFEALKKFGEIAGSIYDKITPGLSKSGKEKLGSKESFIKDVSEDLWKSIKENYKGWSVIKGSLKTPFTGLRFGIEQTGKRFIKPAWEVSSALNPIKMHKNLSFKEKLIGGLTASTIYEGMTIAFTDEELLDAEHIVNIPFNAAHLATVGVWTILAEPLSNTIYGKFKGFEQRDFLPAYIDNTFINGTNMPYELGESVIISDKEVINKTIKAFKEAGYEKLNPEIIRKLEDRLKESD